MASNLVDCSDSTKDEKMASWMAPSLDDSMEMMMESCSDSMKAQTMASWTAPRSDDSMVMMMEDCSDLMKAEKMASWTALSLDDLMVMTRESCSDSTKAEKMASWTAPNLDDSKDLMMAEMTAQLTELMLVEQKAGPMATLKEKRSVVKSAILQTLSSPSRYEET